MCTIITGLRDKIHPIPTDGGDISMKCTKFSNSLSDFNGVFANSGLKMCTFIFPFSICTTPPKPVDKKTVLINYYNELRQTLLHEFQFLK